MPLGIMAFYERVMREDGKRRSMCVLPTTTDNGHQMEDDNCTALHPPAMQGAHCCQRYEGKSSELRRTSLQYQYRKEQIKVHVMKYKTSSAFYDIN